MRNLLKFGYVVSAFTILMMSCAGPDQHPSEGDSGDSATLGSGSDTTGTTVDTGSTVTDSL
ncbi:MAG TPA: hypothetical protein VGE26_00595 [Sphingobacteriaceae bacterium]